MNGRFVRLAMLLLVLACVVPPVVAQTDPGEDGSASPGELQRELRKFFADGLRAELDLTDEQVQQVMPKVQALERERGAVRRERGETLRGLRHGIESGASDAELQELLERYDGVDRRQLEIKDRLYGEIDGVLTVRQRVRMRFYVERFPRMMREKIEELRGGSGQRGARGRPPNLPSWGQRP